jgi:solute carrier family 25 (mitochondrial carnitine/acylcarnitine transporter), member 20/29
MAEGPVDFLKSQMQVQIVREKTIPGYKSEFTGVANALQTIVKSQGALGLYQVSC